MTAATNARTAVIQMRGAIRADCRLRARVERDLRQLQIRAHELRQREALIAVELGLVERRYLCGEAIGEIFETDHVVASEMSATRNGRSRMLRLTIELVPGGFEPLRRPIASMRISNMSDLADCSDYRVETMEAANALTGDPARNAECMVLAHDRKQSVWALLAKACHKILKANYDNHHERANCSSVEVQLAIGIDELPDDAPLVETMRRLAEEDRNED